MLTSKRSVSGCALIAMGLGLTGTLALSGCKKTVISDKVTPIATETPQQNREVVADTVATIKITGGCDENAVIERTLQISVVGIANSKPVTIVCKPGQTSLNSDFEIPVSSKVCNQIRILADLKTPEKWGKGPTPDFLNYTDKTQYSRSTAVPEDAVYFQLKNESGTRGMTVGFEDHVTELMNIDLKCKSDGSAVINEVIPVFGNVDTCRTYLDDSSYRLGIDHNDVVLSFNSTDPKVKFVFEGNPNGACFSEQ